MVPPSAIYDKVIHQDVVDTGINASSKHGDLATKCLEPGLSKEQAELGSERATIPDVRVSLDDPYQEREYQKGRLVLAFGIFAKLGYDEGIAGHITMRDPVEPTSFWVNPFGVAWPLLKASDLIRVNAEGKVVDGGSVRRLNLAAYMIHHAIHEARPDVNAVAHAHSIYGRAFCTLGRGLDTITQDSCAFHNDLAVYSSFRGIVLAAEEGIAIAKALGNKKAALLQNHGLLTCGKTIESTLLADAAAGGTGHQTVKIDEKDAKYTYEVVGSEKAGWFSAKPQFDIMEHEIGVDYKL